MISQDDWGFFVDIEDYNPNKNIYSLERYYEYKYYTRPVNLYTVYEKPNNKLKEIHKINDTIQWTIFFILMVLTIKIVFL